MNYNFQNSLMALRNCLVEHTNHILERSRLPATDPNISLETREYLNARIRELLLQVYKLGFEVSLTEKKNTFFLILIQKNAQHSIVK